MRTPKALKQGAFPVSH